MEVTPGPPHIGLLWQTRSYNDYVREEGWGAVTNGVMSFNYLGGKCKTTLVLYLLQEVPC